MKFILLLLLIGCTSPLEPEPIESDFSILSASALISDVVGGKGILLTVWVLRVGEGKNDPEVQFHIKIDDILIETVFAYPEIAPADSSIGFAAKATARPYTTEELRLIIISAKVLK